MEHQKINLDIRTILAQLDIDIERYNAWKEVKPLEIWEDAEWLECVGSCSHQ